MIDTYVEAQLNPNTKRAYANDIAKWQEFLNGREPTRELAINFRNHLVDRGSLNSAVRTFNTVRGYYRWARLDNPFEGVKAPSRVTDWTPTVPDEADVSAVLAACTNSRDLAILTLLNNGLRAQEVVDLSVENFRYEPLYDAWIISVTGKGKKIRRVPANRETVDSVLTILPERGKIFPKIGTRTVYGIVEKWAKAAGVSGMHPHAFRHSYATRLVRAEVNVLSLQRLLGHSRADTTAIYTNLDLGDLVRESRKDPRNA